MVSGHLTTRPPSPPGNGGRAWSSPDLFFRSRSFVPQALIEAIVEIRGQSSAIATGGSLPVIGGKLEGQHVSSSPFSFGFRMFFGRLQDVRVLECVNSETTV